MTTTALYVEIVVIGVEVELWCILLIDLFFKGTLQTIFKSSDNAFIIVLSLIPAYIIGMIFDRLADRVFYKKEARIKLDSNLQADSSLLVEETPKMHEFQLYTRSKYRVLRATTINLPFIFLALILNLLVNHIIDYFAAAIIVACGILLTILSCWSSIQTARNFYSKAQLIESHHKNK